MKKIFNVLLLAVALCAAVPSQAQVKFGVKGGLNVTEMSFSSSVIDKSNQTGFFIGPTLKFTLPIVGLGIDVAALYDQRDAKLNDDKISQKNINIPINARYSIGLGSLASFYLAAGPQFGFNVGSKEYTLSNVGEITSDFKFKESNFSVNLGAGLSLANHLELGFTYNIACGKTGEVNAWKATTTAVEQVVSGESTRTNAWQIYAAYYF
jgi:opacity protein-like surface antigen